MNQARKNIGRSCGVLIVAVGVTSGLARVIGWLRNQTDRYRIEEKLRSDEVVVHRGKTARRALDVYAERSLPSDAEIGKFEVSRLAA